MKKIFCLSIGLAFVFCIQNFSLAQSKERIRVIATTDGEIDDRCSMVRFLMYANDFDIKGIIHSSSRFHWKGGGDDPGEKWHPVIWLDKHLAAYAEVYPNLVLHDPAYPSPEYLNEQVFIGNINHVGEMKNPTPGSERIVQVLLEEDTSQIWLQAWGGPNTIARALKTIEEKHPERKQEIARKAKLFMIIQQDSTYLNYIAPRWPEMEVIISDAGFEAIGYPWERKTPEEFAGRLSAEWMNENILKNHGPFGPLYEAHKDGKFRSEGDSPSFMHQMNTGLRSTEHPSFGGWGGRFEWNGKFWASAVEDGNKHKSVYRWIPAFQNDWAARADWCVKTYEEANHPPRVTINTKEDITKQPGDKLKISAKKSSDPDKDELSYKWWQYEEADTYAGKVEINNPENNTINLVVPSDAESGETIHIICEVTDDGTPALTRYQRIIINIK